MYTQNGDVIRYLDTFCDDVIERGSPWMKTNVLHEECWCFIRNIVTIIINREKNFKIFKSRKFDLFFYFIIMINQETLVIYFQNFQFRFRISGSVAREDTKLFKTTTCVDLQSNTRVNVMRAVEPPTAAQRARY